MSKPSGDAPDDSRRGRKLLVRVLFLIPIILILIWECGHRIVFGDFFFYGHHVDLVMQHERPGKPSLPTTTSMRVGNYTVFPLRLEGIRGSSDSFDPKDVPIYFHFRLEKWDGQRQSWSTVFESPNTNGDPNIFVTIYPGRSLYTVGNEPLATVQGIRRGDTVRYVLFTHYQRQEAASSQLVIYSPSFVIDYDR